MLHKMKPHFKTHGKKYLAFTLLLTLAVVLFQYRPSQFRTTNAAAQEDWATPTLVNTADGEYQQYQNSVRTSDGKYMIVHDQSLTGGNPTTMRVNKLNADGTKAWTEKTFSDITYRKSFLMSADNSGGAFIGIESYNSSTGNYDVSLKYLDTDGTLLCSRTNIYVSSTSSQRLNGLAYDGNNGVYFHWMEYTGYDGFITHLYYNGTTTCALEGNWNTGGTGTYRPVYMQDSGGNADLNSSNTTSKLITDSNYDLIAVGQERSNYYLFINKFDGTTGAIYTGWPNYIYLASYNVSAFDVVSDGSGGVHVTYNANNDGSNNRIVKNVHVLGDGSQDATMTKNLFQGTYTADIMFSYLKNVFDSSTGSVIAGWDANYYIDPFNYLIFSQKIDSSGNLWDTSSPLPIPCRFPIQPMTAVYKTSHRTIREARLSLTAGKYRIQTMMICL